MSPRAVEKRARPGNVSGPADDEPTVDLAEVGTPAEQSDERPEDPSAQE